MKTIISSGTHWLSSKTRRESLFDAYFVFYVFVCNIVNNQMNANVMVLANDRKQNILSVMGDMENAWEIFWDKNFREGYNDMVEWKIMWRFCPALEEELAVLSCNIQKKHVAFQFIRKLQLPRFPKLNIAMLETGYSTTHSTCGINIDSTMSHQCLDESCIVCEKCCSQ